jgi:hypothetical protein
MTFGPGARADVSAGKKETLNRVSDRKEKPLEPKTWSPLLDLEREMRDSFARYWPAETREGTVRLVTDMHREADKFVVTVEMPSSFSGYWRRPPCWSASTGGSDRGRLAGIATSLFALTYTVSSLYIGPLFTASQSTPDPPAPSLTTHPHDH